MPTIDLMADIEILKAQVARLEGELEQARKDNESKDEELRLAHEDFSPEAWEQALRRAELADEKLVLLERRYRQLNKHCKATRKRLEGEKAALEGRIAAKDAALRAIQSRAKQSLTAGAPVVSDSYHLLEIEREARAALSGDGKGWLSPEVKEQAREALEGAPCQRLRGFDELCDELPVDLRCPRCAALAALGGK